MVDRHSLGRLLEQARHQRHADPQLFATLDHAQENLVRRGREGDDHLAHAVIPNDLLEVPAGSEHRQVRDRGVIEARFLIEEADRLQTKLRMLEQPLGRHVPDLAGSDDQRRYGVAGASRTALGEIEPGSPGNEVDGGKHRQSQCLSRRVRRGGVEHDAQSDDDHRGQTDRDDERAQIVEEIHDQSP
jgi:hypothetical protein